MNATASVIGCAEGGVPFNIARDCILSLVPGLLGVEDVRISECVGRAAAEHILASDKLPRFDQSAMDGYAVGCADVAPGVWHPVTGRTAAGEMPGQLPAGSALRIMTGAPLPCGADTVIAQEDTYQQDGMLRAARVPPIGTNVRWRGEDIELGQVLVTAGTRLDWRHVTVLAAQGMSFVAVRRQPRITLLSSGRELRGSGETLAPGQIHDSNLPMLSAPLLQATAFAVLSAGNAHVRHGGMLAIMPFTPTAIGLAGG